MASKAGEFLWWRARIYDRRQLGAHLHRLHAGNVAGGTWGHRPYGMALRTLGGCRSAAVCSSSGTCVSWLVSLFVYKQSRCLSPKPAGEDGWEG